VGSSAAAGWPLRSVADSRDEEVPWRGAEEQGAHGHAAAEGSPNADGADVVRGNASTMPGILLRLAPVHLLLPIPYLVPVVEVGRGSRTCTEAGEQHAAREEGATGG
jgi:hypothetical protein